MHIKLDMNKMINTRKQLVELFVTLNTLLEEKDITPGFKYAAAKNLRKLEKDVQTLMYIEAGIENLVKDYKDEYKALVQKYGIKGDNGKYQIDIESEVGLKVKDLIEVLNIKYKDVLDKYTESEQKYSTLLEGDVVFDFVKDLHKIKINDIPKSITKEQLKSIIDFELILDIE